jgi:hypothetical protein
MSKAWMMAVSAGLALVIGGGPAWAEVFAYPKKGQTQAQFEQDQFECHKWAKEQTGVDPTQPQPNAAAPPPQRGGAVVARPGVRPWGPSVGPSAATPGRARQSGPALALRRES